MRPSITGGANWSGAAVDPETGHLFVTSRNADSVMKYRETEPGEPATLRYVLLRDVAGPQMPRGLPLWKPPYSRVTAIDMNSGEHVWMTPLGNGDRFRNNPMLRDLDLPPLGGDGRGAPLLTKTLLIIPVSAGGSDGGPRLVAYDKASGAEVASLDLPGGALGAPITYLIDDVQYIALTVGADVSGLVAFRVAQP